ncbi:MAG: hypothetical protein RL297_368 [Pseudomonadota bacterium]|jgi:uncharacterized protein (DUF1501 family)
MNNLISPITRRAILQKASALALAPAVAPLGLGLMGMANAATQTANDYKALVYVFLSGGNDAYNTVVPYDPTNYDQYYLRRKGDVSGNYSGIAVLRSKLAATALSTKGLPSGMQMALNPTMGGLKRVFDAGRAGILMNVGLLKVPTTLKQFKDRSVPLHGNMFSHTQSRDWRRGAGKAGGWGGQVADLFLDDNPAASLSCINVGGPGDFLVGGSVRGYRTTPAGPAVVSALSSGKLFGSAAGAQALDALIRQPSDHLMSDIYTAATRGALDLRQTVLDKIGTSVPAKYASWFPAASGGNLAAQLQMVARLIEQGPRLDMKRQIFIVGLGGFDKHDGGDAPHASLIGSVSTALEQFDAAMMGLNMANSVTAFTGSDFGRQLTSNGDGTDHGWGGHQLIVGGAVNGGRFFGEAPVTGTGHSHDARGGALLPTTATEQLSVELGRWFGVSDADLGAIFPNSRNFDLHKLGVFKA